ncbi:protein FAM216A [Cololabis saira]|uniref:protein FAM216A n=1 Tax=Cololabis saira TaxID=129043 RepID=UPI002AD48F83|nr:protein FAM216A [Cololabis saira]
MLFFAGFERLPGQQLRGLYRGTLKNVPAGGLHTKMLHGHTTMLPEPFLQHPFLAAGQTNYLYGRANIYSTEEMRRQMKQHYLNVVHAYIHSGQSDTCRRECGDYQRRENGTLTKDGGKDMTRSNRGQMQRKIKKRVNSGVILPKIVNR